MEQKRAFLAIALSIGVLIGWNMLFGPKPSDAPPDNAPGATTGATTGAATNAGAAPGAPGTPGVNPATPGSPGTPGTPGVAPGSPVKPAKVIPPQDVTLDDKAFASTLTNAGGRVKSFKVLEPEQYQPRGDLIAPTPPKEGDEAPAPPVDPNLHLPLATSTNGTGLILPETAMYEVVSQKPGEALFRYTDPNGLFTFDKLYRINPNNPQSYNLTFTLTNTSAAVVSDQLLVHVYGHQDPSSGEWSLFNPIPDVAEAVCYVDNDDERDGLDDAKDNPVYKGEVTWGGVDSRYFTKLIVPGDQARFVECKHSLPGPNTLKATLATEAFTIAPKQARTWNFTTYIGPKDMDVLEGFNAKLERTIDYGLLAFLCNPIRWLLVFFYNFTHNWGVAIILLTILLRMLLLPINHQSYKNMEGMRRIQEPMQKLKEKYENDPMKMQEEMMKLYKTEGVSPFGCLPQLFQIPIFFALYRTIYSSVELYHADFIGWYTDLSAPDPYFVLPVLVAGAMFGQQLLMPQASTQPQMKMMMYLMPLIFSAFTFVLPSGLALYIFVSVILGVGQQFYIRKSLEKDKDTAQPA